MELFESRASVILYNILLSNNFKNKFILPLNICPIVPITFLKAGIEFEFIDIQIDNLCIDQNKVFERIQKGNISGILFAHTFGIELNTDEFFKKVKDLNPDIFIIDDRCLMIPTFDFNINVEYSDLILYSTGYVKYVDIDWGGYGFLKDSYKYEKIKIKYEAKYLEYLLKNVQKSISENKEFVYKDNNWLGSSINPYKDFSAYKEKILGKIEDIAIHKKELNSIYKNNIPKEFHLGEEFNTWRFSLLLEDKEKVLTQIFENKLFASSHYKEIDYLFNKKVDKNSNAKKISNKILNLFNDFRFTKNMAYDVSEIIRKNI